MADAKPQVWITPSEVQAMQTWPDALRALAGWHDYQETMADAMDNEVFAPQIKHHRERRKELTAEADRIEREADAAECRALGVKARAQAVTVDTLRQHWLRAMECDHASGRDKPHCACSLVDLGWHPSVGAAVEAWLTHVSEAESSAATNGVAAGEQPKNCRDAGWHPTCIECANGRYERCLYTRPRGVAGTPDSAVAAGKQAREDGTPRTANPYKRDRQNELWHAWDIGWCRTREEEDEALRPTLRADANDEDPHVMSALNDGIQRDAPGVGVAPDQSKPPSDVDGASR